MIHADNFHLDDYLKRIGYDGEIKNDLRTLFGLMSRQLQSIPFENTQVQAGKIPSLDANDIVKRVIYDRLGGYCYELNGLFAMALSAIGFEWYLAAARPMFYPTRRPRTHMVLIVKLDSKEWLCDCGFGGYGLREPIEVANGMTVVQNGDSFKIEEADGEYILSTSATGTWANQYGFTKTPQEYIEFSLANYFNATHPDTIFTQKKLSVMQTPNGRKILVDNLLKKIENGATIEEAVNYEEALQKHFYTKLCDV